MKILQRWLLEMGILIFISMFGMRINQQMDR